MSDCSICTAPAIARGWCGKHWARWARHGDPLYESRRPNGAGSVRKDGYLAYTAGGKCVLEHIRVAETVLGKRLPKGAVVHHVDENPANNTPTNLVICPNQAYHQLLHLRQRALDACGHAEWRKCYLCGQYEPPEKLRVRPRGGAFHMSCAAKAQRERKARGAHPSPTKGAP